MWMVICMCLLVFYSVILKDSPLKMPEAAMGWYAKLFFSCLVYIESLLASILPKYSAKLVHVVSLARATYILMHHGISFDIFYKSGLNDEAKLNT